MTGGAMGGMASHQLINSCNSSILNLVIPDMEAHVVALDGQPVPPYALSGQFEFAPAQRMDVALRASGDEGTSIALMEIDRDNRRNPIAHFKFGAPVARKIAVRDLPVLPANPLATDLALLDAENVDLLMTGGAMGGMASATYEGREMGVRELVAYGKIWAFNGVVGMTDKPLVDVPKGRTVVINMVNDTAFPHAMHLHGHHFKVTARNNQSVGGEPWRDTLLMTGGAMGGMASATYEGREMGVRELVAYGKIWAFNGVVGMTDKPLVDVPKGRTVVINMVNDTAFPHAMHLHGHHFKVTARNNQSVGGEPWRDTLLVQPEEKASIAFVADNPGKWLFHCHMLEHQAAGMVTWLNVKS